jgi:hypothetical protein
LIVYNCEQGSDQWRAIRAGRPTASCFDKILTPAKLKASMSQDAYAAHLVAEWFLGEPIETAGSGFTDRGTGLEPEARRWYAFDRDADVTQVGFCTTDDGAAGCSPDGLVGDEGGLELKCPGAVKHMEYLLGGFGTDYILQVQGCMYVTGRKWWDRVSYHPTFPKVVERVLRDETMMVAIDKEVRAFVTKVESFKAMLLNDRSAYMERLRVIREQEAERNAATMPF